MKKLEQQKKKLEQKKNKLAAEETRLRLTERKARTRHLIELGGLLVKAKLDHLPTNALYGALLSLDEQLKENENIKAAWIIKGDKSFNQEQKTACPVIVKFVAEPIKDIRDTIRLLGLKWNKFRQEWYGHVADLDALKNEIKNEDHQIDILK
ncbi:conjugal transfer protein TraD [Rickettsiaceae bacterium]|nr:conjugal transfer protein TraD [Rickettsiaceae bacterium]